MAVMQNSIIFGGIDSADFGIYIGGEGTFDAPKRDVEMISIPGRNGAFALDKGRFENIEVTYSAFNFEPDLDTFSAQLEAFRNAICSQQGYQRLTDTFHPDEYRMAAYIDGLEIKPINFNTASTFDIVFDCKPQRFLTSGEEPITIGEWHETETASGEIASFEAEAGDAVKSLVVNIEPTQSGSGTPSPTNVRPISGYDSVVVTVADDHDSPTVSNTYTTDLNGTRYGGTLDVASGVLTVTHVAVDMGSLTWEVWPGYTSIFRCGLPSGCKTVGNQGVPNWLCSAYAVTSGVSVSSTVGAIGQLHASYVLANNPSYTDASAFKTAMTGQTLVYELATPTTVQLTAQEVELLVGLTQVWANSGDVEVEYGTAPNALVNPTLFEASPMLEVWGRGEISINDETVVVNTSPLGNVTEAGSITPAYTATRVIPDWFVNGDVFTIAGAKFTQNTSLSDASWFSSWMIRPQTAGTGASKYSSSYVVYLVGDDARFVFGTASTVTKTGTIEFSYKLTASGTWQTENQTLTLTIAYDGDRTITYTGTPIDEPSGYVASSTYEIQSGTLSGFSNKVLNDPLYIDLDIGVAYKVVLSTATPYNDAVTLPPELPTLKSGVNEITADNTVTDLKVVPRWWKI